MSNTTTPNGNIAAPVVPQASGPNQVVGLVLQNTTASTLAAQPVTFGEVFAPGAVQKGDALTATINGKTYAVQMDAKTFNADGSVRTATLTMMAPALPANTSTDVMLSTAAPKDAASDVNLAQALDSYSLVANLNITANAGGATGQQSIDIVKAVKAALANGQATYWEKGPLATEAVVSIPVSGSLRIEADITAYANGQISTRLQFNNDIAMTSHGGTVTYSAQVVQNGTTVLNQPSLTQYQYQDWSTTVGTVPSSTGLNVQHDIAYLEKIGAVPNYDLQFGVPSGQISGYANATGSSSWNKPLATDGITQYMPSTGGRPDIGPTTGPNAAWLITQNASAAQYALGQALEAGSIPWHFYDPTANGTFVNTADYANFWSDPRGGPHSGTTGLTQQVSGATGWAPDTSHTPDLSYVAYLQTGNIYYLEQLNAQANFAVTDTWNQPRLNGTGLVVSQQVPRASAWALRTIQEAAYANPAGSSNKAYFTQIMNNNYSWLISKMPSWQQAEGQAYGYLPGSYGGAGAMAPWMQDYFASTVVQGAEMGNSNALHFLQWQSNYLVGRFFAEPQGFNPRDAIAYNIGYYNPAERSGQGPANSAAYYKTWSQIEKATQAMGGSNVGNNWLHSNGDYGQLALQTLAGIITVSVQHPNVMGIYQYEAMQAFGWLLASGAPYVSPQQIAAGGQQFLIVPRLANGQLLSYANVNISTDTTATLLRPKDASRNALLHAGAGTDTLVGGSGINLLFGGSGNDVIVGGPNGNDIFAGSANDTIFAGGGATYIQASTTSLLAPGTGQDLFVINQAAQGAATISGFDPNLDHLDIVNGAGSPVSASAISRIVAGATVVGGNIVLNPGSDTSVVIEPVSGAGSISSGWFQQSTESSVVSSAGGSGVGSGTGATPGGTSGGGSTAGSGGSSSPAGGSTGAAGSGGLGSGGQTVSSPGPSISGGNLIEQAAQAQTVLGATGVTFADSVSGSTIDVRRMVAQSEAISLTGSNNVIDGLGEAGGYPTNGTYFLSGTSNTVSLTGGILIDTGTKNKIIAPSNFAYLQIVEKGQNDTVTSLANSPIQIDVEGHGNTATFDGKTVVDTVGGYANTVSAGVYSNVAVVGTSDLVSVTGVAAASVSGSNDTLVSAGSNRAVVTGEHDLVSVPGNAWTARVTVNGSSDTVEAGPAQAGGDKKMMIYGGSHPFDFTNGGSEQATIVAGAGGANVTAGGGSMDLKAGSGAVLLTQGSGDVNVSAGSGNMTLNGGAGSLKFAGGSGHTVINQGAGAATISSGGTLVVNAGSGRDLFQIDGSKAGGSLTVNNFSWSNDYITTKNFAGVTVASDVITTAGGRTRWSLSLSDGTKVTLNVA